MYSAIIMFRLYIITYIDPTIPVRILIGIIFKTCRIVRDF